MTTQRRGELAIQFFWLATLAKYLDFFLPGSWSQVAAQIHMYAMIGLSAALVAAARPLSRLLFAEPDAPGRIHDDDIVYIGARTYGLNLLTSLLWAIVLLLAHRPAGPGVSSIRGLYTSLPIVIILGALLLWLPRPLQRLLPSGSPPDRSGGRQVTSYVESALIIMAIYVGVTYLSSVAFAVFEGPSPMTGQTSAARWWIWVAAQVVPLAGAALLLYFHRSVARWFYRSDEDEEAPVGPAAGACVLAAFALAFSYVLSPLCSSATELLQFLPFTGKGGGAVRPVVYVVRLGLLVAGILFVPPVFWRLARWLHPDSPESASELVPEAWVPFNVALTVVIVYSAIVSIPRLRWEGIFLSRPTKSIIGFIVVYAVLLLFRADIAWLFLGRPAADQVDGRRGLRRGLEAAFPLVGLYIVLGRFPGAVRRVVWSIQSAGRGSSRWPMYWIPLAAGVVLIAVSGPLARLLSHRRIAPRIWEKVRRLGWRPRGGEEE